MGSERDGKSNCSRVGKNKRWLVLRFALAVGVILTSALYAKASVFELCCIVSLPIQKIEAKFSVKQS